MDERADDPYDEGPRRPGEPPSLRELAERLIEGALGAVALTRDRVDHLAEEATERGRSTRGEARGALDDAVGRLRNEGTRLGARAQSSLGGVFHELGLATRAEVDELELRVAQLEHRLALLEGQADEGKADGDPETPPAAEA